MYKIKSPVKIQFYYTVYTTHSYRYSFSLGLCAFFSTLSENECSFKACHIYTEGFRQIKGKTYRFRSFVFLSLRSNLRFCPRLTIINGRQTIYKGQEKNRRGKIQTKWPSNKSTTYVYWEKRIYCANANPERPNTSWRRATHRRWHDRVWNLKTFWNTHAQATRPSLNRFSDRTNFPKRVCVFAKKKNDDDDIQERTCGAGRTLSQPCRVIDWTTTTTTTAVRHAHVYSRRGVALSVPGRCPIRLGKGKGACLDINFSR